MHFDPQPSSFLSPSSFYLSIFHMHTCTHAPNYAWNRGHTASSQDFCAMAGALSRAHVTYETTPTKSRRSGSMGTGNVQGKARRVLRRGRGTRGILLQQHCEAGGGPRVDGDMHRCRTSEFVEPLTQVGMSVCLPVWNVAAFSYLLVTYGAASTLRTLLVTTQVCW